MASIVKPSLGYRLALSFSVSPRSVREPVENPHVASALLDEPG